VNIVLPVAEQVPSVEGVREPAVMVTGLSPKAWGGATHKKVAVEKRNVKTTIEFTRSRLYVIIL
jgi:hypothetical protein